MKLLPKGKATPSSDHGFPFALRLRSARRWTAYVVFCRGAVLAHKLLGAFAEARELSQRRSCRASSKSSSFFCSSTVQRRGVDLRSLIPYFRPGLPLGQREIQTGGMTSDRRLTTVHLSRDRGGIFPGRGQSLKNDIFIGGPRTGAEHAHFFAFSLVSGPAGVWALAAVVAAPAARAPAAGMVLVRARSFLFALSPDLDQAADGRLARSFVRPRLNRQRTRLLWGGNTCEVPLTGT
jgi:hypothetical protein